MSESKFIREIKYSLQKDTPGVCKYISSPVAATKWFIL